jgi:hypothetical protein
VKAKALAVGAKRAATSGTARLSPRQLSGNVKLAFLRHPLESFGGVFDPVLTVVTVGRKQPDDLIGAAGGRAGHVACGKIDSLTNVVLVFQRPLHHAKTSAEPRVLLQRPNKTWLIYTTRPFRLASYIGGAFGQFMLFFQAYSADLSDFG